MAHHACAVANILASCINYNQGGQSAYGHCFGEYKDIILKSENRGIESLSKLSLIQLRDILYLVMPYCYDYKDNNNVDKIKGTIKYIEKDLYRMTDDQKNGFDLVAENQKLKNRIIELEKQLSSIKQCF